MEESTRSVIYGNVPVPIFLSPPEVAIQIYFFFKKKYENESTISGFTLTCHSEPKVGSELQSTRIPN
jgi:hypothetical protein